MLGTSGGTQIILKTSHEKEPMASRVLVGLGRIREWAPAPAHQHHLSSIINSKFQDKTFNCQSGKEDPSGLWQGWRALARPKFLSMCREFVSYFQPIRFARFDGKSVNRGLPVLDEARTFDPCHRPEGSWALGKRMPCHGLPVLDEARTLDPCHRPEGSWALGTRMPCHGSHRHETFLSKYFSRTYQGQITFVQATSFPGSLILPPGASEERPWLGLVMCYFDNWEHQRGVLCNQAVCRVELCRTATAPATVAFGLKFQIVSIPTFI